MPMLAATRLAESILAPTTLAAGIGKHELPGELKRTTVMTDLLAGWHLSAVRTPPLDVVFWGSFSLFPCTASNAIGQTSTASSLRSLLRPECSVNGGG